MFASHMGVGGMTELRSVFDCWMEAAELKMLRFPLGVTRTDTLRNDTGTSERLSVSDCACVRLTVYMLVFDYGYLRMSVSECV